MDLIGLKDNGLLNGCIREIFANAFERGNGDDNNLPVSVKIAKGRTGSVLRFRDSGKGFRFRKVINKKRVGKKYFKVKGAGMHNMDLEGTCASFEGNGSIVNLQVFNRIIQKHKDKMNI